MIKRLALIGASGHGKVIADIARANGIADIVFYDDRWQNIGELNGCSVVGSVYEAIIAPASKYDAAIVTIGDAVVRGSILKRLSIVAPALVHPSAYVSSTARLGMGTVVMPNAVINADAVVGDGVIINSGAVVEHDCVIDEFAHVAPNAAIGGGVHVGKYSWIGIGSSIIQSISIGDYVTVGAGSVVIRDIPHRQTVVGNPAKPMKQ